MGLLEICISSFSSFLECLISRSASNLSHSVVQHQVFLVLIELQRKTVSNEIALSFGLIQVLFWMLS